MVKVEALTRVFIYNGVKLPDPGPNLSVEQVRDMYVATYPELATAVVEGPSPGLRRDAVHIHARGGREGMSRKRPVLGSW